MALRPHCLNTVVWVDNVAGMVSASTTKCVKRIFGAAGQMKAEWAELVPLISLLVQVQMNGYGGVC